MSKIKTNKLQHTAAGASEFTLPTADGNDGQFIKTNGSGALSFATPSSGNQNSLQVLEKFYLVADGRSVSTSNGTVQTQNVVAKQALTDSFAILSGSVLTYQPPTGTTEVIYEYKTVVSEASTNNRLLYSWYLELDTNMIDESRETYMNATAGYVHELAIKYGFRVNTGGTDNDSNGDRAGLGSITFKVAARRWASTYAADAHYLYYFGGSNTANIVKRPQVGITAIGSV